MNKAVTGGSMASATMASSSQAAWGIFNQYQLLV